MGGKSETTKTVPTQSKPNLVDIGPTSRSDGKQSGGGGGNADGGLGGSTGSQVESYGATAARYGGGYGGYGSGGNRYGAGGGLGVRGTGMAAGAFSFDPVTGQIVMSKRTEIYPLASITAVHDISEIEATIRDAIKTEGISADSVKLSFHEKTNVLIVTGEATLHELIHGLFSALRENNTEARTLNESRHLERLTKDLEALMQENSHLKDRIQETNERSAKYKSELDQARQQIQNP